MRRGWEVWRMRAIARRFRGRKPRRRGACFVAALGAVLGVVAALGAGEARAEAGKRLAILPIVVHTSDSAEYLRSGLADMLASRLGRVPGVAVIRVDDPAAATTDVAAAQEAGRAAGAEFVVFGSFTRFGEGASLDVRCARVDGPARDAANAIFIQSGTLGEVIPRLDPLAERVGRYVASGGVVTPDVVSGSPAGGAGVSALRGEVEALRVRVEALERELQRARGEVVPEVDLGRRDTPGSSLGSNLR
jgi:TolB-like protein